MDPEHTRAQKFKKVHEIRGIIFRRHKDPIYILAEEPLFTIILVTGCLKRKHYFQLPGTLTLHCTVSS